MSRSISPPSKRRRTSVDYDRPTKEPSSATLDSPPPDVMRIFSWNINGIAPFLQKPITSFFHSSRTSQAKRIKEVIPPASLRGFLHRHHWPAVLFLQEVKIASTDTKTQNAVRSAVNAALPIESTTSGKGPAYEVHLVLPTDRHNARGLGGNGKVYGVCSIIRSDLFLRYGARFRTVDWDQEGRVSIVELQAAASKLALFNIYAVNGTDNPYRDPATGAVRGTRHDRKLAFHRRLMEECLRLEDEGWGVLVAGDMNVAPSLLDGYPRLRTTPHQHVINRADFNSRFLGIKNGSGGSMSWDGVDVWRQIHETERRYTYFPRSREWGTSCDRVDYVIAGRSIWEAGFITGSGILDSEAERGPSDHVPVWVDVMFRSSDS